LEPKLNIEGLSEKLPDNSADKAIPKALARAHVAYLERHADQSRVVYVLFVVQEGERNYVDQRLLEYELGTAHKVPVLRRTLSQIHSSATIIEPWGTLVLDQEKEVSVVYFRAGYTPNDYPTANEWHARSLLESSLAIKCPSIAYHLVGAKKIQQHLAEPAVLEAFVDDDEVRSKLRKCFAGLWSLGHDLDANVRKQAIENPEVFVVKPQREGGGNNIYGSKVRDALETMTKSELAAHILMERIFPSHEQAVLVRNAVANTGPALSELGIYSVFLGDGLNTLLDESAGHLLRTKFQGVDEGGVASGFSSLNSPLLTE